MKKITIILKSGNVCRYTDSDENLDKEKTTSEISKLFQSSKINVLDVDNSLVFIRPSEIALLEISLNKTVKKEISKKLGYKPLTTGYSPNTDVDESFPKPPTGGTGEN